MALYSSRPCASESRPPARGTLDALHLALHALVLGAAVELLPFLCRQVINRNAGHHAVHGWHVLGKIQDGAILVGRDDLTTAIPAAVLLLDNRALLEGVQLRVRRSDGSVDEGWQAVFADRRPGFEECVMLCKDTMTKSVPVRSILDENRELITQTPDARPRGASAAPAERRAAFVSPPRPGRGEPPHPSPNHGAAREPGAVLPRVSERGPPARGSVFSPVFQPGREVAHLELAEFDAQGRVAKFAQRTDGWKIVAVPELVEITRGMNRVRVPAGELLEANPELLRMGARPHFEKDQIVSYGGGPRSGGAQDVAHRTEGWTVSSVAKNIEIAKGDRREYVLPHVLLEANRELLPPGTQVQHPTEPGGATWSVQQVPGSFVVLEASTGFRENVTSIALMEKNPRLFFPGPPEAGLRESTPLWPSTLAPRPAQGRSIDAASRPPALSSAPEPAPSEELEAPSSLSEQLERAAALERQDSGPPLRGRPSRDTQMRMWHETGRLPLDHAIHDGFEDGGRQARFDAGRLAESPREVIVVNRDADPFLTDALRFARFLRGRPPRRIADELIGYVANLRRDSRALDGLSEQ